VFSLYFTHPLALLLFMMLPPLLWWQLRQKRRAVQFSAASLVQDLPAGRSKVARVVGLGCRFLGLALLILALSGPRWPDEGSRIPTEGMSIVLVVDVSYSMKEEDFQGDGKLISRLQAVKNVFELFVKGGAGPNGEKFLGRRSDLLSLIVFAKYPETICPLTHDHGALISLLRKQDARLQETNIGDAIFLAWSSLEKSGQGRKAIVLFTDGEQSPGAVLKPRQAAQLAGNAKVKIYSIDAGKDPPSGAKPEELEERKKAKKIMQDLANLTDGACFHATDAAGLLEICRQIDEMERYPILTFEYRRYYQAFVWFALGSLGLFTGILVLEQTLWRRLP
jgi:Ca-activated chloride channel family protein